MSAFLIKDVSSPSGSGTEGRLLILTLRVCHQVCREKKIPLMVNVLPEPIDVLNFFFRRKLSHILEYGVWKVRSPKPSFCPERLLHGDGRFFIQRPSKTTPELAIGISLKGPGLINPEKDSLAVRGLWLLSGLFCLEKC